MPAVQQLQDLGEVGKVQVRLGALLARPAGLTRTQGGLNWLHFLWLCAIPPTAIATYFKRRQLFNRSDRKGASKNYVPGSESTKVSVPTQPHSYSIPMAVIKNVSIPSVIYLLRSVNSRYYNKLTVYVCPRFFLNCKNFTNYKYVPYTLLRQDKILTKKGGTDVESCMYIHGLIRHYQWKLENVKYMLNVSIIGMCTLRHKR